MNILLTGSSGLIGKNLLSVLSKSSHKFVCIDKKKTKIPNTQNIVYLEKDLLNEKKLLRSLKNQKFDLAIHFAAFLGVKKSEKFELECLNTNIQSTINILNICKTLKIRRLIFSSSSEVYGNIYKRPIVETDYLSPVSAYGVSKVCCEEYIKAYAKKKIINFNILRFFNVYGKDQRPEFVISKFANLINKKKLIEIYGNGNQVRSYCNVKDAVIAVIKVINSKSKNQIYNVGNDLEPISLKKLFNKFQKIKGKKLKKKFIPFERSDRTKTREIFFRAPNIGKIKKLLRYKPKIKLNEGIKEMLKMN